MVLDQIEQSEGIQKKLCKCTAVCLDCVGWWDVTKIINRIVLKLLDLVESIKLHTAPPPSYPHHHAYFY